MQVPETGSSTKHDGQIAPRRSGRWAVSRSRRRCIVGVSAGRPPSAGILAPKCR